MDNELTKIYIIGYGNRNRQDDSLGPELAERLRKDNISGVTSVEDFQLSIENAYDISISGADVVIFIDASFGGDKPFSFNSIKPLLSTGPFSTLVTPETILYYCKNVFDSKVRGYLLGIRGYGWEFSEKITEEAMIAIEAAYVFIKDILEILLLNIFFVNRSNYVFTDIKTS